MERAAITFNVPLDITEKAKNAGLLTDEIITEFLLKELERQEKINRLFEVLDKLRDVQPPLTQEEIDAEIQAYRDETR